ncbi:MAG TPA: DNA repair protein RecN [Bacteroidia bacterium]|nr:DNA repair protein RecN [Bacteroidia bacterium]
MLKHLSIQNYALIEKVEIDFSNGLSIITGETGAGKSILLGALSLIAGERADASTLQDKTSKCVVEGTFDIHKYSLKPFFVNHDLDYADQTVIRREISPEGKSRAFINDTPVTLAQLRELSYSLIDIHSQHETLTLNEAAYQLSVIDAFALKSISGKTALEEYKSLYKKYKYAEGLLADLQEKERKSKLDIDYWQFQFDELHRLNLKAQEQEKAEEELKLLENAEEIKSVLNKVATTLNGSENAMGNTGVLPMVSDSKAQLNFISRLNAEYNELLSRLSSVYIELKDIANEIENLSEKVAFNPTRAQELTERLDAIYGLQEKHRLDSVEQLIAEKENIERRLKENSSLEIEINNLQKEVAQMQTKLFGLSKKISADRIKSIPKMQKEVSTLLSSLAMPNAQFRIEHILLETLTEQGIDKVKFLFSANKGSDMKDIYKVASGGELSRLMLCIKSIMAQSTLLPTIVFDEIDTGVSGGVADKMGEMILDMGHFMQVITITHLPQIASKGTSHFTVYKEERAGKTFTQIRSLSKEERITEVAKMLSAGKPTEAAIKNAKELLNH